MKFRKRVLTVLVAAAIACGLTGLFAAQAEETTGGWYNAQNGNVTFTQSGTDVVLELAGNESFGSSFALNDSLAQGLYSDYRMSFDLDANLSKGEQVWVSAIPIYDEEAETAHRVGLHFQNNDWLDIAIYGTLAGEDKGFAKVVGKDGNFPALTDTVHAEISIEYDSDFHAVETLKLNGTQIYSVDLTELYGNGFFHFGTASVGFDVFDKSEDIKVSNIKVEAISKEYSWTRASINNYFSYTKNQGDFTSKRLSAEIDTADTVRAFTQNATILSGMFAGGLSHNYVFNATIKELTEREGSETGFYVWYLDLNNYILLKSASGNLVLEVVLGGQVQATESVSGGFAAEDEISVQKYTNLGKTSVTVAVNGEEALSLEELSGFDENYYVGLYGKNVAATFSGVGTESFYVPYDFVEENDWITSGFSETAWNTEGEYPSVTSQNTHAQADFRTFSAAVTEKVVNDTEFSYTASFAPAFSGNFAYGMVPYYRDSANYLLLGVQRVGGAYSLLAVSASGGVLGTKAVGTISDGSVTVSRRGAEFTVSAGGESLTVTEAGATDISEYYGYFFSGQGNGSILSMTFEGFESFRLYEKENGWITSSVKKDDITFTDGTIEINGDYTEAGLTADTEQRLAKAIRPETYKNDYVIEVDITRTVEPSGACQREGVVAWYLDENNYFIIFIDQWTVWEAYQLNACGVYRGERMVDSSFNDYQWFLGMKDTPGYIDSTIKLKVLRNDQTIKAWLGNELIFSKTFDKNEYDLSVYDDDELKLGVFAAGLGAKFENYTVRAMTASEGTPTPSKGNRPVENPDNPDNPNNPDKPNTPDKPEGCGGCNKGSAAASAAFLAILAAAGAILKWR